MSANIRTGYLASNIALVTALLLAVTLDLVWLQFAATGFIWFMLLIYLSVLLSKETLEQYRRKAKPARYWTWWVFDIVVVTILIGSAWYVTTAAYIASCVCHNVINGGQQLRR
jgi:hypothetical protein